VLAAVWSGSLARRERAAREDGLKLAARFAARTVASEIDLRWRILELEAKDAELLTLLQRCGEPAEEKAARLALQDWLARRLLKHDRTTQASSWYVNDRTGILQAVVTKDVPENVTRGIIGKNFAYRDYFHGQGRDLDPAAAATPKPIEDVHRSVVFLSQYDQKLKVGFSVPIRDAEQTAGILVMTVELGHFGVLQTQLGSNQLAVLADTRPDWVEKTERNGLILHHPRLEANQGPLFRLDPAYVQRLEKLRALRLRQENLPAPSPVPEQGPTLDLELDYRDPSDNSSGWLAAFEPVIIRGRPERIRDTGWVVIVQERK
jgi:eukaryotic-like serine/threonine-protein kinase